MKRTIAIAFTLLVLIGGGALLSACHTAAGAGEDISATGQAVTHTADKIVK